MPLVSQPTPVPPQTGVSFAPALLPGSLKLALHGTMVVRGSVGVGLTGAGGRLEVDLLAKPAAIGLRGRAPVVLGRFVRASTVGGTLRFSVSLPARARTALRHRGRLALSARATLTPREGAAARLTRTLTLWGRRASPTGSRRQTAAD